MDKSLDDVVRERQVPPKNATALRQELRLTIRETSPSDGVLIGIGVAPVVATSGVLERSVAVTDLIFPSGPLGGKNKC